MTDEEFPLDRQLYELSSSDARIVLDNFLSVERGAFVDVTELAAMPLDYSRESVIAFFQFAILQRIGDVPGIDIYSDNFRRDESRIVWPTRMAYYLGEALIKASQKLRWDIGDEETAFANHPVVSGFNGGMEAPVIAIARNLTARILMDQAPFNAVVTAIDYWFDLARA